MNRVFLSYNVETERKAAYFVAGDFLSSGIGGDEVRFSCVDEFNEISHGGRELLEK